MAVFSDRIFSKFAILGGGIAGVSCAEQLSSDEPDAKVVLISASPTVKVVKNIIKISDRLEEFSVEEEKYTCFENRYSNCNVISALALKVEVEKKEIVLSNGQIVTYEVLCICAGAVPKVIAEGCPFVLGIRDTETVQVFQKRLSNAKRVLIVGNGGIATELVCCSFFSPMPERS